MNTCLSKSRKLVCQKLHNYLVCIHATRHAETQTGQYINKTKLQIQNSSLPSSVSMWPVRVRFALRCPNEFPRVSDTLAEKAWEGAAQGIGKILVHVTFLKTKLIFASSVKRKEVRGDGV